MSFRFLAHLSFLPAIALLAACGEQQPSESADDFAARVNGGGAPANADAADSPTSPSSTPPSSANGTPTPPKIAQALPGAAPGPVEPNTATDPATASCGAPSAASFLGKQLTAETRKGLAAAVPQGVSIRILGPGSSDQIGNVSSRLNLMVDGGNYIRDLRCG